MEIKQELLKFLPSEEEILSNLSTKIGSDKILHQIYQNLLKNSTNPSALEFLDVILDFLHDSLHIGEWHLVDIKLRKSFSVASYLKVLCLLDDPTEKILQKCAYLLDMAIMLGDSISTSIGDENIDILSKAAQIISSKIKESVDEPARKKLKIEVEYENEDKSDIPILDNPSIEYFITHHFNPQKPVLLRNTINHWPAVEKWKDLNYLLSKAGSRTVPVELGSQYTSENWSQSLMKFSDFVQNYVLEGSKETVYLAQHDLFDQIPELKDDIRQPEYITDANPRLKAWFGPKGTVSPLHTDPTHNLLCQVLGKKQIILASPDETPKLYPHEHFILNNTSQVNVEEVDFEKFPLCKEVKFLKILLQPTDVLYIPPKWWHHVRSLSASFSISFWFDQNSTDL